MQKTVNFRLWESTHQKLKIRAAKERKSVVQLIDELERGVAHNRVDNDRKAAIK